jgi:hypothetical protein
MTDNPKTVSSILPSTATAASLTTTMGLAAGQYKLAFPERPPAKPPVEIAPNDHPIYSLVGRAASAWAHLEHTLDLIIWDLVGREPERIACITAQLIGATNRYKAIESLLLHKKNPKLVKALEHIRKLKQKTYDPQEDRNRIIHDPWYLYDTDAAQFRAMPPKDPRFGVCKIDVSTIEALITNANNLAERAAEIRAEIGTALAS